MWSQDAQLKDATAATMTAAETKEVNDYLSLAGRTFNKIAGSALRELEKNETLAQHIETHGNSFVRKGELPPDPKARVRDLIKWIKINGYGR